eukprot:scaffold247806_cov33-Tisochrysis_lutea.AAC.1
MRETLLLRAIQLARGSLRTRTERAQSPLQPSCGSALALLRVDVCIVDCSAVICDLYGTPAPCARACRCACVPFYACSR